METQTTETSENSTLLPVTTKTLEQSALPQVTNTETPETLEQSTVPPPVTNMETPETLEQSTLPPVTNKQETETVEPLTLPPVDSTQKTETLEPPVINTDSNVASERQAVPCEVTENSNDNVVPSLENHDDLGNLGGIEMRQETAEEEEVRSILKVIAATGKFWHDWEKLRSMLSIHLKQVLSEYPQAKMTAEEQKSSLGETHAELAKRLDDALHSFDEGPPFTLQRLSEIILDAQSIYPNLSKLALALEKNLLVTSTLTISTNPYLPTPNGLEQQQSDAVLENGVEPDRDEIMTDVEADVTTMDVETYDRPSDTSSMTTADA